MNRDWNGLVLKFKSGQLKTAGKSACSCKLAVIDSSYSGFQAFWAIAVDVVDTDLSRNPRLKYWSSTLPAILPERARARLGLPVSYARTPSRNAPLNALARLILSPNPSGPHTLKVTWPCPEYLPAGMVFERRTCVDSTFKELFVHV